MIDKLLSYIPSPLPVGMTEFDAWSDKVIKVTGPLADPDSMKFVLASNIMSLKPTMSSVPIQYFVKCLRKAAANQVAGQVFQSIKDKQREAQDAAKKQAEDTANQKVAASEQTPPAQISES